MPDVFVVLVANYGYAATFAGTLLEGETFLLLSGVAAQRGLLDLSTLFVVSAAGAFCSDNLFFALGRASGPALLARFPGMAPSAARANALVDRLPYTAVIGVRFLYGMRAVGPAAMGAGRLTWSRFALLDALAASLWGVCWTSAGYLLGEAVEQLLEAFTHPGRWLFVGFACATVIAMVLHRCRRRRTADASRTTDT
jgi:membrane protein DedA with SNARE-associated domain